MSRYGIMKEWSDPAVIMCDYDTPTAPGFLEFTKVFHTLGITPISVRYDRTKRGWHVVIVLPRDLHKCATVALQAILGSDPRRETLNLMRALSTNMDRFASQRWNVLFESKLS